MIKLAQKTYTPTKYLELETKAEIRHELINREIIPMAGGTTNHNEIVTNLCLLIKPHLRQKKGKVYTENVRLWIPEFNLFTYPDVMIIKGEPIYYSENQTTVTNPVVIIEVLSDSTRDYDQGRKFGFYRSVKTLQ
jgi:Uma2 family endonuclease